MRAELPSFYQGAERPALSLWLFNAAGSLIDFSVGFTFTFKLGAPGSAAVLTKTAGITGATGAGVAPSGTPNVQVVWTAGELGIPVGAYTWQLQAVTAGLDRFFSGQLRILAVVA